MFRSLDLFIVVPLGLLIGLLLPNLWSEPPEESGGEPPGSLTGAGDGAPATARLADPEPLAPDPAPEPEEAIPPLPPHPVVQDMANPTLEEIEGINEHVWILALHYPDALVEFARESPELCQFIRLVDATRMMKVLIDEDYDLAVSLLTERRFYVNEGQMLYDLMVHVKEQGFDKLEDFYNSLVDSQLKPVPTKELTLLYIRMDAPAEGFQVLMNSDWVAGWGDGTSRVDDKTMNDLIGEIVGRVDTPEEAAALTAELAKLPPSKGATQAFMRFAREGKSIGPSALIDAVPEGEDELLGRMYSETARDHPKKILERIASHPEQFASLDENVQRRTYSEIMASHDVDSILSMAESGHLEEHFNDFYFESWAEGDLDPVVDLYLQCRELMDDDSEFKAVVMKVAEEHWDQRAIDRISK